MNEEERFSDILSRFEQMLKTNTNFFFDLDDFLDIIDEYVSLGNFNMAKKAVEIALTQYADNIDILLFKAEIYSFVDRLDKAEELIEYIRTLAPDRVEVPLLEAEIYSRKDKHIMAIEALQRALKLTDEKAEVYEQMTVEYLYLDNFRAALDAALSTLKFEPLNATALYNAVTCFELLDRTEQAIDFLKKHVDNHPFSEISWNLLAKKYIEINEFNKALEALDFSIAIDDKFLGAYYDKAFAYTKLRNYDKALECYQLTLSIADATAFTYYHIAKIYEAKEQYLQAAQNYLLAITEDPGHYKSWKRLIQIKMKIKDYNSAYELTKKSLEIINNQELFEILGKIQVKRNRITAAIDAYEKSLKLGNYKLETVLQLVDLYKQTQQIEKFRTLLLEAKKMFPNSKEIQKRMFEK